MQNNREIKDYTKPFNIIMALLLLCNGLYFFLGVIAIMPTAIPRGISIFLVCFDAILAILFLLNRKLFKILTFKSFALAGFLIYFNYSIPIEKPIQIILLSILLGLLSFGHSNKTTILIFVLCFIDIIMLLSV